jgi:hypothetical protein
MSDDFTERFNTRYKEMVERTRRDYEKKNRKFQAYIEQVGELYRLIEQVVEGTPITIDPMGIDYKSGAASLRIDHNNEREKPASINLFLRTAEGTGEQKDAAPEFIWHIKIGYKNFKPFERPLLERLLETIFLS